MGCTGTCRLFGSVRKWRQVTACGCTQFTCQCSEWLHLVLRSRRPFAHSSGRVCHACVKHSTCIQLRARARTESRVFQAQPRVVGSLIVKVSRCEDSNSRRYVHSHYGLKLLWTT